MKLTSPVRELTSKDQRLVRSVAEDMKSCESWSEIGNCFIQRFDELVPSDFPCLNFETPDLSEIVDFYVPPQVLQRAIPVAEATPVFHHHHPVISTLGANKIQNVVGVISDFCGAKGFFDNPLYSEVYKHIDTRDQMVHNLGGYSGMSVWITINRSTVSFSQKEKEMMVALCKPMQSIFRELEKKLALRKGINYFSQLIQLDLHLLSPAEIKVLMALMEGKSIENVRQETGKARSTLDRQIASTREKLGMESTRTLLSHMVEIKSSLSREKS